AGGRAELRAERVAVAREAAEDRFAELASRALRIRAAQQRLERVLLVRSQQRARASVAVLAVRAQRQPADAARELVHGRVDPRLAVVDLRVVRLQVEADEVERLLRSDLHRARRAGERPALAVADVDELAAVDDDRHT